MKEQSKLLLSSNLPPTEPRQNNMRTSGFGEFILPPRNPSMYLEEPMNGVNYSTSIETFPMTPYGVATIQAGAPHENVMPVQNSSVNGGGSSPRIHGNRIHGNGFGLDLAHGMSWNRSTVGRDHHENHGADGKVSFDKGGPHGAEGSSPVSANAVAKSGYDNNRDGNMTQNVRAAKANVPAGGAKQRVEGGEKKDFWKDLREVAQTSKELPTDREKRCEALRKIALAWLDLPTDPKKRKQLLRNVAQKVRRYTRTKDERERDREKDKCAKQKKRRRKNDLAIQNIGVTRNVLPQKRSLGASTHESPLAGNIILASSRPKKKEYILPNRIGRARTPDEHCLASGVKITKAATSKRELNKDAETIIHKALNQDRKITSNAWSRERVDDEQGLAINGSIGEWYRGESSTIADCTPPLDCLKERKLSHDLKRLKSVFQILSHTRKKHQCKKPGYGRLFKYNSPASSHERNCDSKLPKADVPDANAITAMTKKAITTITKKAIAKLPPKVPSTSFGAAIVNVKSIMDDQQGSKEARDHRREGEGYRSTPKNSIYNRPLLASGTSSSCVPHHAMHATPLVECTPALNNVDSKSAFGMRASPEAARIAHPPEDADRSWSNLSARQSTADRLPLYIWTEADREGGLGYGYDPHGWSNNDKIVPLPPCENLPGNPLPNMPEPVYWRDDTGSEYGP